MFPQVALTNPTRDDVRRLVEWLEDPEVNRFWYGKGDDGVPLHASYDPSQVSEAIDEEWDRVFGDDNRRIFAIYTDSGDHIGEAQLVIEWPLLEAQAYIIVGRKDLWHQHYGTMGLVALLDYAFNDLGLHRAWVDIPDYNTHAKEMVEHIGFVLEGQRRQTHRKDNEWYDSHAFGLLADEFVRRRNRLLGAGAA